MRCRTARRAVSVDASEASLLLYGYFCSSNCFAGEEADFAPSVGYDAVFGRVNGVVAGGESAVAAALGAAGLAYDYLAGLGLLAAGKLNP